MYETCFKLRARPFLPAPQVSRYYPATAIEDARQTLTRCIERGEGPCLLIGQPGTGKSLLCHLLAHACQDRFAVVLLDSGRVASRQALLQAILHRLGLPCRGLDEGESRLSLLDFLEPKGEQNDGLVLLVDEAHTLPLRLLEEIRMITNLVRDGQPRVRVVLAGSPLLEERFASPKLSAFSQRLAARSYLEALDGAETAAYVRAQIAACGGDPTRLVDEPTLTSIYRASDGIPRLINQICDHAMILASLGGADRLSSSAIEEAWADLQQLPPPHTIAVQAGARDSVVEFGKLDDADDDLPEAIPFQSARPSLRPAPENQLDAIEHRLSEVDAARAQYAVTGTQVELEFPKAFGEQFEEEEVVLDRYASDVEIFAEVQRVSGWECQQLAPLGESLVPLPSAASRPATTPPLYVDDEPQMISLPPLAAFSGGPIVCEPAAAYPPTDPSESEQTTGGVQPSNLSATLDVGTPQEMEWIGAQTTPDDRDVIGMPPNQPAEPTPTDKKEYKQLFAKLRRG